MQAQPPHHLQLHSCLLLQLFTSLMGLLGPKTDSTVNERMKELGTSSAPQETPPPPWLGP